MRCEVGTWLLTYVFIYSAAYVLIVALKIFQVRRVGSSSLWLFSATKSYFFVTPWTAVCQASLSSTISRSLLKFMSIESILLSNQLILCRLFFLLPSIFPSIRVFSSELAHHIKWPKYWSFCFKICPPNEYSGLISLGLTGLISLQSKGLSRESSPVL